MFKQEFEAQIIDDFKTHWIGEAAKNENMTIEQAIEFYDRPDLDKLHERISGKRVIIEEHTYPLGGENDFWEKEDNNFVIFRKLFAKL